MIVFPIMLACNNRHGNPDNLHVVEITNAMSLEAPDAYVGGTEFDYAPGAIVIAERSFPIHGHRSNVGNIHWDAVSMEARHLVALIHWLQLRSFRCTEGWTPYFRRFNRGDRFRRRQLRDLMGSGGTWA